MAVSLAGAMLISDVVKLLVSRSRPPVAHLQAVAGSGFPSGHATQASAFWFSLVLALRATRVAPLFTRVAAGLALGSYSRSPSHAYTWASTIPRTWSRASSSDRAGQRSSHAPCDRLRSNEPVGLGTDAQAGAAPGSPADEALCPCSLLGSGRCPGRDHPSGELLPTLASHRGRARHGWRPARPEGRRPGDRSRSRSRRPWPTVPPSCSCAGVVPSTARRPHAHPHAALDLVSFRSQCRCVRVRNRRLRTSCRCWRRCSFPWQAPLPTRACTSVFTTRAMSRPVPRSGSAPACSPHACRGGFASEEASGAGRRRSIHDRAELYQGRTLGAGRSRGAHVPALVAARGPGGRGGAGRDPRSAGDGLRRARGAPRGHRSVHDDRLPASATRCSGPRGCWCSDPTLRSRR